MITDHTNPLEAWVELAEDHERLGRFRQKRKKKAISIANDSDVFPFFETVDYTPPGTNNTYKVFWRTEEDKDGYLNTVSGQYLPIQHSRGRHIYLYSPETSGKKGEDNAYLWIITPHFQSRYRERAEFPGVDNVTELVYDILDNISCMTLSIVNHEKVNRNFVKYNNTVDGEKCNCYIPMVNGVAFIDETVHENESGKLPRRVHVIEMRTFVDTPHLSSSQKIAVMKDVDEVLTKTPGRLDGRNVIETVEEDESRGYVEPGTEIIAPPRYFRRAQEKEKAAKERKRAKHQAPQEAPAMREFTDEEVDAILEARASGATFARLAATYSTNTDVIRRILDENDVRLKEITKKKNEEKQLQKQENMAKRKTQFTEKEVDEMVIMYKNGSTRSAIASKFHTDINILYPVLEARIKELREKEAAAAATEEKSKVLSLSDQQVAEILLQCAKGDEYRTVAARFEVTVEDVVTVVNNNPDRLALITQTLADERAKKAAAEAQPETTAEDKKDEPEAAAEKRRRIDGPIDPKTVDELVALRRDGATLDELAELCGRARHVVRRTLEEVDASLVGQKMNTVAYTDEIVEKILELRRQGLSTHKIADELDLNQSSVHRVINKVGDPLKGAGATEASEVPAAPKEESKETPAMVEETAQVVQEVAREVSVENALNVFSVAEIFRHLYSLGYYIPDGKVNFRHEVEVAEDDEMIINLRKAGYNIDPKTITRTVVDVVDVDLIIADAEKEN